jgi:hypothetical protein
MRIQEHINAAKLHKEKQGAAGASADTTPC